MEAVHSQEGLVEVLDLLSALSHQGPGEAKELRDLSGHSISDTGVDVYWHLFDPVRGLLRNLLDIHPTVRAGNDDGTIALPVHEDAEIGLPGDVNSLGHHDFADWDTAGRGLLGDQPEYILD